MDDFTDVSEMTALEVARLDAVGAPANGTDWLILKSRQEAAVKRDMDPDVGGGVDRDKIPAEDFAGKHRSFPIVTPKDVHDAATSSGQAGDDNYPPEKLKANIIRIAKRKGPKFVAQLPKSWQDGDAAKAAPDADAHADSPPAASTAAPLPTDGSSDSLGDQNTSPDQPELTGQTTENCAPPPAPGGEQQAGEDAMKKKGKRKRHMDNPDAAPAPDPAAASGGAADSDPGSSPWEHKDVALGEQTIATLEHALQLARTFTEREKAESTGPADTSKEIEMTRDELVKLLDERDEARRASERKAKKAAKKAKKAEKAEKSQDTSEVSTDAEVAAKATKADRVAELEARLAAVESQPARPQPILNGGGQARPEAGNAFKQLEDRIAAARNLNEELDARSALTTAKMIAVENARARGELPARPDMPPDATPMLTTAHLIGDDASISGVN